MAEPGSRRALGAALLASSLMPLNSTMIAVALPEIAREFARPPGTVAQAVVASYLIAAIVLQSPGGKLGDRLGHWRILALGQVLVVAGAVLVRRIERAARSHGSCPSRSRTPTEERDAAGGRGRGVRPSRLSNFERILGHPVPTGHGATTPKPPGLPDGHTRATVVETTTAGERTPAPSVGGEPNPLAALLNANAHAAVPVARRPLTDYQAIAADAAAARRRCRRGAHQPRQELTP